MAEKGNIAGVSTVGSLTGYAVETVAGTKPAKFIMLHRINASDEITIDVETIDASALEDEIERTIAGRGSTGGTFNGPVPLRFITTEVPIGKATTEFFGTVKVFSEFIVKSNMVSLSANAKV